MKFDNRLLKSLPKVLLHEHLDGVLRPQTVIDLAREEKYPDLPTSDAAALAQWFHQGANKGSLAKYLEGFAHYQTRRWEQALPAFREALQLDPSDGPSRYYQERCETLLAAPPEMIISKLALLQSFTPRRN